MKAVTFVEIDLDFCSLRHNRPPCMAAIEGDLIASTLWRFHDGAEGWAGGGASFDADDGFARLTTTSDNPIFQSPSSLTIDGSEYRYVRIDIEKIAERSSGTWDGRFLWSTGDHGFLNGYRLNFPEKMKRLIHYLDMFLIFHNLFPHRKLKYGKDFLI